MSPMMHWNLGRVRLAEARVKGAKAKGVRVGNWLSIRQAQALLNAPDATTKKGLRDRGMLAILIGCGLRRSEVAALTLEHIQQRDNRWCIIDLVGKHGRVRTVPMPAWVKAAIVSWVSPAAISYGPLLRRVSRGDRVQVAALSEKVVWQLLQGYANAVGLADIAPHDLRRTCAKLCRAAGVGADPSCFWVTSPFKRRSVICGPNRIWSTLPMTESS